MRFLKKRSDYILMYNKKQAEEMLMQDSRVKKIECSRCKMVIYTKDITATSEHRVSKNFLICPIGTYKITIIKKYPYKYTRLIESVESEAIRSLYDSQHYHISAGSQEKICWGTAQTEVDYIKSNSDWFWYAKRILDLLEDGTIERGHYTKFFTDFGLLMYLYAKKKNNKELMEKICEKRYRKVKKHNCDKYTFVYSYR